MRNFLYPYHEKVPGTASIWLIVTFNGMHAYLVAMGNEDAKKRFSAITLENGLKSLGLRTKLDHAAIQHFASTLSLGEIPKPVLIAKGRPATCGPKHPWQLNQASLFAHTMPMMLPNFYSAGTTICTQNANGKGTPGLTVWGDHCTPFPGQKPEVREGIICEDDKLVAGVSGFLYNVNNQWSLLEDLFIKGDKTKFCSPLRVAGSISIEGPVSENVTIEAGKNFFIQGDIQRGAHIQAGQSVRIDGTVKQASIQAGEGISCYSARHAILEAEGDIEIRQSMTNGSKATSGRSFFARRGSKVSNAIIEAFNDIVLWTCETEHNGKTSIYAGVQAGINKQLTQCKEQLVSLYRQKGNLYKQIRIDFGDVLENREILRSKPKKEREAFQQKMTGIREEQEKLDQAIGQLKKQQDELTAEIKPQANARIMVHHGANGHIDFWLGKTKYPKESIKEPEPFMILLDNHKKAVMANLPDKLLVC